MNRGKWAVFQATEWTRRQVGPPEFFATKEAAQQRAAELNRANPDESWNRVTAYIHNTDERLRA